MMKYVYYPGCSAESTARDQYKSTLAVSRALGLELIEPEGWTCCGSTPAHQVNHDLAISLASANLAKVKDMGLEMVVSCASCFNRMKTANHEIISDARTRDSVSDALGKDYDGSVPVRHFLEIIIEDLGLEKLKKAIVNPLKGLKVASYYGCLLVRPHEVTGFDDSEHPLYMDRIVDALGAQPIDWPYKLECCGGSLTLTRADVVVKLTDSIIGMAKDSGADCIVVACPMCQLNLDMRQSDILKATGKRHNMPVIYITQLIGLSLGIPKRKLGLNKLLTPPDKIMGLLSQGSPK